MSFELTVDGQVYGGWTKSRVTLGIEQMAAAFELSYTQQWPGSTVARPIRPGALCKLALDGKPILTGYVDEDSMSLAESAHTLSVSGRSKTADLIDCAAIHKTGQWRGRTLTQIATDLAAPFGIKVRVDGDVGLAFSSFALQEGETVFEALDRAARQRGLLLTSDGNGDLVILRTGNGRAPAELLEGVNVESISVTRSMRERFSQYRVKGQGRGNDNDNGATVAGPMSVALDTSVPRYRPTIVLAEEQGVALKDRAQWEKQVRMGRGLTVNVTVSGFSANGVHWKPNTKARCVSPAVGLDSDLLIVEVTYNLDESGTRTELRLMPPEALATVAKVRPTRLGSKLAGRNGAASGRSVGKKDSIKEVQ